MRVVRIALSLVLIFPNLLPAVPRFHRAPQQITTASSTATTMLQQSLAALAPKVVLTDVTLSGSVRRIAGSDDETGTVLLRALASGASRVDLSLPSGQTSEIRAVSLDLPSGAWAGPDGISHRIPFHDLLTEPAWFFPAFGISHAISIPGFVITYVGLETRLDHTVHHLSIAQPRNALDTVTALLFQHQTQTDYFLDTNTLLPVAVTYITHPDSNAAIDIPVEIQFSNYQTAGNSQVPFRVQHFLNNVLFLDIELQTVSVNTGLTSTTFSLK
jgi:hypothetical protein